MVKIIFNGARAKLTGLGTQLSLGSKIAILLQWTDLKIERSNKYQKFGTPQNPVKSCYNAASNSFPTGLIPKVCEYLDELKIDYTLHPNYEVQEAVPWQLPDWAWNHQKEIVEVACNNVRCMIKSPTASGKSKSILWVTKQYPTQRILITVPQIELMHSLVRQAKEMYDDEPIGQVGGGKKQWERITVGIINSLAKHAKEDFKEQLAAIDILIGDECHTGATTMYQAISDACTGTFMRLGVSGTAYREDGSTIVLEGVFGPLALAIPEMEMINRGVSHKPEGYFVRVPAVTGKKFTISNGKPEQREVYLAQICNNIYRNTLIVKVVKQYLHYEHAAQVLILVSEIDEHGIPLQQLFSNYGLDIPFVHSHVPKKEREQIINDFSTHKFRVLLSSPALNIGVDFPSVGLNVIAGAGRGKIGITQKTGRCVRADQTGRKTRAIQVDFWDEEPYYYESQAKARMTHLNSLYPDSQKIVSADELLTIFSKIKSASATNSSSHRSIA